jgi:signal peptide peptidase SppA
MENQLLKGNIKSCWKKFCCLPLINKILTPKPRVAVIRMSGVIADGAVRRSGISHSKYAPLIEKAFGVHNLEAVALVINSPGGAPAQSSLIAGHVRKLAEEKPVYTFIEDVAASGGYWLACAGDEIYAQESSVVGSVGVISSSFGLDEFIKKHDISRRVYTSGRDKSFLDPFLPEKEADISRLKKAQKDIHEGFKRWVKERRGDNLKGKESELFEGGFWTGSQALEKGLIDGIGEMREKMREKFGKKVKFEELHPEKKLIPSLLRGEVRSREWLLEAIEAAEERATWSRFGL